MSGHTPGPWSYRTQPHDDWGVVRAGRYIICQARDPRVDHLDLGEYRRTKVDPFEANARLIAAAPDLLEALEELFASYKRLADSGDAGNWALEDQAEGKLALAALSKARGAA